MKGLIKHSKGLPMFRGSTRWSKKANVLTTRTVRFVYHDIH